MDMENEAVQPVTLNIPGGRLSGEWTLSLSPPGGSSRAWTSPSSNGVDPPSFFMPQDSPKFARRTNGRSNKGSSIFGSAFKPTNEELTYLEAAEYGDIPTVKRMVEGSRTLNVNCVDYMGQNALQLACGNEHLEVVEILIKQPAMARIGDALLLAISRGYLRIVEIILNHPAFEEQDRLMCSPCEQRKHSVSEDHDFYAYDDDGTRFSPDITPVILAAQCQEFDIVHDLLRRGARITQPHHYRCLCRECSFRRNHDSLSHCLSRLNAFKGLASPAYLSLANPDPVLAALKLSHSLTTLANVEKEFKNDYLKLATQCNDFVEKLLDLCRDTEEVDAILDGNTIRPGRSQLPKYKANKSDCTGDTESNPKLCQLKLAMKYKVKKFVAHPNCQQKLMGIWNKEVSWMRQLSIFYKTLLALGASLLMPVLSLIYIFVPYSKVGRILQSPICKFALQAIAYVQFVTLLMINCLDRMESFRGLSVLSFLHHQHEPTGRHTKFNWCEIIIMIYILGLLWNELKELWQLGPRAYICQLWNIIDFFMLLILITSFTSRAIAYMKASVGQRWWTDRFGDNATIMHYNVTSDVVTLHGHPVAQGVPTWAGYYAFTRKDRSNWHSSDPELVAEAFYSYGLVLSFSRICYILEVNEKFGPLQISLARTVTDIIKWCGIFFIIFGSFMLGLYNLYSSYAAPGAKKNKSFTTIEETFITLFWSMFGLADYRGVEVNYDHELTRIVGYQLYGAYNIVTVVVMLNMLIAMINSSYAEVEHDSDVEWKFARAELMLSYFERGQTLPVPYNLIPVPRAFTGALSCAFQCFGKHSFKRSSLSGGIGARGRNERRVARAMLGGDHATGSDGERQQDSFMTRFSFKVQQKTSCTLSPYETLICGIVKRFVLKDQVENTRNAEITEAELQEIKHDISSLRFELLGTTARYEEKINTLIRMLEDKGKIPRSLSEQVSYSTCIKGQRAVPPNNLKVTGAN